MNQTINPPHKRELFGHPVGLYVLFFTELWERFSYYGMRAILTLYMLAKVSSDNPGLGWEEGKALATYGWYTMLVYVVSIPGGIIADKIWGQKKSVMIGGWLLVAGHGVLSIEQDWAFFSGLLLIVLGVGLLKPNISTMVGGLYKEGDPRRDKGFSIFYIGINVGAAVAAILVGIVAQAYGWHYGFGLAAIGMVLGQVVYVFGQSEVITIMILFHLSGFKCFKHFYIFYVQKHMLHDFPRTVSYNRFTELMQSNVLTLTMFLKTCCKGTCTGISFVDSTPIRVCKNKRIKSNKVFKDLAQVGRSTMGWFYGFKLHIVINDKGEILNFTITAANVDDREPLKNENFLKEIFGKLFADKGYISKKLENILFVDGIHLITQLRNNMKIVL